MELKTLQIWRKKLDTKLRKKTRNFIIKKNHIGDKAN